MVNKSIVGDPIGFRGLIYAPVNELGVVFLFALVFADLNMFIEGTKPGFPDCVGGRFVGRGWERVAIEFEYRSSNFRVHRHDKDQCNIIVCWEHDWADCPIEVIELRSVIQDLENYPVQRPGITEKQEDVKFEELIKKVGAMSKVKEWYEKIFDEVSKNDENIWKKTNSHVIGWYSPERAFVSIKINKAGLYFSCFSGGQDIEGTVVANEKNAPRWVTFTVKSYQDAEQAVGILNESYKRIKAALNAGEQTGYYSGSGPCIPIEEETGE